MQTAVSEYAKRCSPPIYALEADQQYPVGTGTLIAVAGGHFLVTAAHVIQRLEMRRTTQGVSVGLGIPTSTTIKAITGLVSTEIVCGGKSQHDVAVISLRDPGVVTTLRKGWTFLTPRQLAAPGNSGLFFVYGYQTPSVFKKGVTMPGPSVAYTTARFGGVASLAVSDDPIDSNEDLLLELDKESYSHGANSHLKTPTFLGVSGASVWEHRQLEQGAVWTPEHALRVVAVQSSQKPGAYLRVKRWHLMWSLFRSLNPRASSAIRTAITKSIPRAYRTGQATKTVTPARSRNRTHNSPLAIDARPESRTRSRRQVHG